MASQSDEPVVIVLDDPPPRGAGIIAILVMIVFIAMIAAPFLLASDVDSRDVDAARAPRTATNSQICRPSVNLPEALDAVTYFALPSWMRLCDWFLEPVQPSSNRPPRI